MFQFSPNGMLALVASYHVLASALLVFFLAPLQRLAERIATFAMPNTQNTPEYAAYKKLQVYGAAF